MRLEPKKETEVMWGKEDVAAYLRVAPKTVLEWVRTGYLPVGQKVGRLWRCTPEEVKAWVLKKKDKE